ncbi:MAG TPA: NADP-dependent oxidoreductase [Flavitalea sp.]|nr:NADP-dependent oxidoreductase [Flavitalea sp.]
MKAILLKDFGGTEQLELTEIPKPVIKDHEVLIRTRSISINPIDVKTRSGKGQAQRIKDKMPAILGWDVAGVVVEKGSQADGINEGDEVFGQVNFPGPGKCYAEFVAASAEHLAIKPGNTGFDEAAAASLAALTAWQAIHRYGKVKAGTRVLIHAASGGVGHFAVQLCKYLGANVTGTSSAGNKEFVLNLGADAHIDYTSGPFEEKISGVDFVLDTIGGDNIDRSIKVMKPGAIIVSLPSGLSESVAEKAKLAGMEGYKMMVEPSKEDIRFIADLLAKKILKPHVSRVFSFEEMAAAHKQLESGKTVGKVVVRVSA